MARRQEATDPRTDYRTPVSAGWWRRNRWGVTALVPALGLALAIPVHDAYPQFWRKTPRTPVTATGGWVGYDSSQMRLVTLTPAAHLTSFGTPITLPAGLRVWRSTITFQSTHPDALDGCDVTMADKAGNTYEANPSELSDLGVDVPFSACAPDSLKAKPPTTWTNTIYFLTPASAQPAGVRITSLLQLPRYAWLTLATG